jgi:hypothetical protein
VRRVQGYVNADKPFGDLRLPKKCVHAYGLLRHAGKLRGSGFGIEFEPELSADFRLRPDARIPLPAPVKTFFLNTQDNG